MHFKHLEGKQPFSDNVTVDKDHLSGCTTYLLQKDFFFYEQGSKIKIEKITPGIE